MNRTNLRFFASLLAIGTLAASAQAEFGLKNVLEKATGKKDAVSATEATKAVKSKGPSAVPDPWPEPTAAFVVPSSIRITASNQGCYRPKPGADCKGTAWFPTMTFNVVGPLKKSAKINIQWSVGGKPWFKEGIDPLELPVNGAEKVESGRNPKDEWAQQTVGTIEYKITADDPLAGSSVVLHQGKFKANKHHTGNSDPLYKNQFEWYVDYDWTLPTAFLEWNIADNTHPNLEANFWFRLPWENASEYTGHLFYNGKEIESTQGSETWSKETESSFKNVRYGWATVQFMFGQALAHNRPPMENISYSGFVLADNPGKYEIKVLRKGELARVASFTILPNGKMDDSFTKSNNLRGSWIMVPAKVSGTLDGKYDANAWKTDMFWGNPVTGFEPPK